MIKAYTCCGAAALCCQLQCGEGVFRCGGSTPASFELPPVPFKIKVKGVPDAQLPLLQQPNPTTILLLQHHEEQQEPLEQGAMRPDEEGNDEDDDDDDDDDEEELVQGFRMASSTVDCSGGGDDN
jgi:hypothetical protein